MINEVPQGEPSAFGTEYWSPEVIGTINLELLQEALEPIINACILLMSLGVKHFIPGTNNPILDFIETIIKFKDNLPLEYMVEHKDQITPTHKAALKYLRELNLGLYDWVNEARKVKDLLGNSSFKKIYKRPEIIRQIITSLYSHLFSILGVETISVDSIEKILNDHKQELGFEYDELSPNFKYGKDSNLVLQYLVNIYILLNTRNIPINIADNSANLTLISPVLTMGSLFGYIYQQILMNKELGNIQDKDKIFTKYSSSFFISSTYTISQTTTGHLTPGLIDWIVSKVENKEEYIIYLIEDFVYSGTSPGSIAKRIAQELTHQGIDPHKILKNVKIISAENSTVFSYIDAGNPSITPIPYDYSKTYVWESPNGIGIVVSKL